MITAKKIEKLLKIVSGDLEVASITAYLGWGMVSDRGTIRFGPLHQAYNGVHPAILEPMVLVFEKRAGLEPRIKLVQKMPQPTLGLKLELESGYEYEVKDEKLFIHRYLWPGDWQSDENLRAVLEETCEMLTKIFFLYCEEKTERGEVL